MLEAGGTNAAWGGGGGGMYHLGGVGGSKGRRNGGIGGVWVGPRGNLGWGGGWDVPKWGDLGLRMVPKGDLRGEPEHTKVCGRGDLGGEYGPYQGGDLGGELGHTKVCVWGI